METTEFVTVLFFVFLTGTLGAEPQGPFVIWGPSELRALRRPALQPIEPEDLEALGSPPRTLVLFELAGGPPPHFPRLRRLLADRAMLYTPQSRLPLKGARRLSVPGPPSEQDAQLTEQFQRLEDVYGKGNVLAVLALSSPDPLDFEDAEAREKRDVEAEEGNEAAHENLYSVRGKFIMYSADYPTIQYGGSENDTAKEVVRLQKTLTNELADERPAYSQLIVIYPGSESGKITLKFKFVDDVLGYWRIDSVEIFDGRNDSKILYPTKTDVFLGAPKGFSFACKGPFVFSSGSTSLTLLDVQLQAYMNGADNFGPAYNCVSFTTVPIWSGVFVTAVLLIVLSFGLHMITQIKTMDRFENTKGKTLSFTVLE